MSLRVRSFLSVVVPLALVGGLATALGQVRDKKASGEIPAGDPPAAAAEPAAEAPTAAASGALASPAAAAAPGGGPGASATEFRNRLVAELKLDAAQVEKVDAIYTSVRPKFMQLRELSEADRAKTRERITADVRARIGDVLTPEQKARYGALVAEVAGRTVTRGRIYVLDAQGKPTALNVRLGISDGTSTELVVPAGSPEAAALTEGALVITGTTGAGAGPAAPRPTTPGPRMMF